MPGNQKRRSRKHRGTQTGSITRAQRSRPRNRQEAMAQARSRSGKGAKGGKRQPVDRRDIPPTWRSAIIRGVIFAALLIPVSLLFGQPLGGAILLSLIAAVFYVPLGFYTESFFYRRRQQKIAAERAAKQADKQQAKGR